jgi:hypothetical protein
MSALVIVYGRKASWNYRLRHALDARIRVLHTKASVTQTLSTIIRTQHDERVVLPTDLYSLVQNVQARV